MRVLFDTNVVLDVLLNRSPWVKESAAVWQANDNQQITGYVVASSLTDIFYIARKLADLETSHQAIAICLNSFEICPVNRSVLHFALLLPGVDFEDNLQIACAQFSNLEAIVTRDKAGFESAAVPVFTPSELLMQL